MNIRPNAHKMKWDNLRSLGFGAINAVTYTAIGSSLLVPARLIRVTNLTDADILISTDGINDKDVVPASSFFLYDVTTNKSDQGGYLFLSEGERLYAKWANGAAVGTAGTLYFTVVYGSTV